MRLFYGVLTLYLFLTTAQAQLFSGIGVRLGGTMANQTWEYTNPELGTLDGDYLTGLQVGIFTEMFRFGIISSQLEINYTQKGKQDKITYTTENNNGYAEKAITNRLHYLSLQAGEKVILPGLLVRPFIQLALRYDILLGKDIASGWQAVYDKFKDNSYGLTLGAGLELGSLLPVNLILEGRYLHDINRVRINENLKIFNRAFDLSVGLKF